MADTRQVGNLTIHFVGDNAAQLKGSFDSSYSGSQSFRSAMSETARSFRDIYVGSSLGDLKDQPGFNNAGFDPNSPFTQSTSGYGKASDAQTYFIVVTGKAHTLIQDGRSFVGSTDLVLVHEFLHPSQLIRDLTGSGVGVFSEANTQMREQTIAQELGKVPGIDFPDVIGTGTPYTVKLDSPGAQPYTVEPDDPTLSIDPIRFEDAFGHPFDGSDNDILLLKAALFDGSIDGWGNYVTPSGSDRYNAPFDSDNEKIVLSAGHSDRAVSIVQNGGIRQIKQVFNDGSRVNSQYDSDGRLQTEEDVFTNGISAVKYIDTKNTHPYNELDVSEDATGQVTAAQIQLDQNVIAAGGAIGQIFGSAIGNALAPNDPFQRIVTSTVAGLIGQKLLQTFTASLTLDARLRRQRLRRCLRAGRGPCRHRRDFLVPHRRARPRDGTDRLEWAIV